MAYTGIFNIQELLEHILHFLLIDKSIYPALYVFRLWYRCGAPILWRRIELKGIRAEDQYRLEKFLKLGVKGQKPVYGSHLTHLKISYYPLLSNEKIKDILQLFPNIIYLDFENSPGISDKALHMIADSYPNLKYLNLGDTELDLNKTFTSKPIADKGLSAIAQSCHKLEYLNISYRRELTEISICNIIYSCPMLQHLDLSFCNITDFTIGQIARLCLNLKYLVR
jgi:Leucine Rich repeat